MNEKLKKLGERIKYFRKQAGYSQEELSEVTGLHRTYIGAIERGERNVTLLNIYKITEGLNITINDLFCDMT